MDNNKIIIIALVAIVIVLAAAVIGLSLNNNSNNNSSNQTLNITSNDTNDTNNTTTNTTAKKTSTQKSSKSDSNIAGESIKENYQRGDGSKYREVQYKDGNIRQYDSSGKLIGSTYDSDQAQLKREAGDSWPGD